MIELFECVPLSAKISKRQCEINRKRVDNFANGSYAVGGCVGCSGLSTKSEVIDMNKVFCKVPGCDRWAKIKGMCKSHALGTPSNRPVKPTPAAVPVVTECEIAEAVVFENREEVAIDLIRTFDTGATRTGGNKPEYAGYLSPRVLEAFGRYMFEHQLQVDGTIRESRNWQKGIPAESYMQSMFRHFMEVWTHYENGRKNVVYQQEHEQEILTALMALFFNVQGMSHELIGAGCGHD